MLKKLSHPTDIAPLAVFRVIFGLIMFISMIRFVANGWVYQQYIKPSFYFSYYGFEWIKPLPGIGMYLMFITLIIAALMVTLGLFYRIAAPTFFILFTYVELIDKANYLNHYYFISIVAFMMIWLPAHRYFSLDVWRKPQLKLTEVPKWAIDALKIQLGIVYFYAGAAKLNSDWMFHALPLKIWLPVHADMFLIGPLLKQVWVAYFFSWFGAIYDLSIPFLLLNKTSRPWAYIAVILFHMLTWWLFPIGMFPFIMIGATLIFFPAESHNKIINSIKRFFALLNITFSEKKIFQPVNPYTRSRWVMYLLAFHLILQILIPWRFLLYPGHLFWTEEGYRFSWRVMLMEKAGYVNFHVTDPSTGKSSDIYPSDYLAPNQEKMMSTQPDMILQFAHYIQSVYQENGTKNVEVRAEAYVTLNGQGSRLYLDPSVDLTKQKESFKHKTWILPYEEKTSLSER